MRNDLVVRAITEAPIMRRKMPIALAYPYLLRVTMAFTDITARFMVVVPGPPLVVIKIISNILKTAVTAIIIPVPIAFLSRGIFIRKSI